MKLNTLLIVLFLLNFNTSCKKEDIKSDEKEILSFSVEKQVGETIIDSEKNTVFIEVPDSMDLSKIIPVITVSEKATISPASGITADFSKDSVIYMVTAENYGVHKFRFSNNYYFRNRF